MATKKTNNDNNNNEIKIKYLGSDLKPNSQVHTIEGIKKLDKDKTIIVSANSARQMIKGNVWKLADGYSLPKIVKTDEENLSESNLDEELETLENDYEESEEEVFSSDEEISHLLKTIPKIKNREELIELAEELGIDYTEYPNNSQLRKEMINVLKGKK